MQKTLTKFIPDWPVKIRKMPGFTIAVLTMLVSAFSARAQSPYCNADHTAAGCPTYNMYIGSIDVKQGSTSVFSKTNDQCNQTASIHVMDSQDVQ